jgi:DMSO/TMAO reductase YedYZ heme-binding membrane subunit
MRSGKRNFTEVWVYGLILAGLLGWRVQRGLKKLL